MGCTWVKMSVTGDAGVCEATGREGMDTELMSLVRCGDVLCRGFCVPQHHAIHL